MSNEQSTELGALSEPLQASGRTVRVAVDDPATSSSSPGAVSNTGSGGRSSGSSGNLPSPNSKHRRSRHVKWDAIDGACAEILSFEASSPDVGVPLSFPDSADDDEAEGCCERYCWCIVSLRDAWSQYRRNPSEAEVEAFAMGRPLKDGRLWKLNSDKDREDQQVLTEWASWRCRHFFMSRSEGKLGLLYISEKQNGYMQLGAILHDFKQGKHNELSQIKELPVVSLEAMTTDETLKMGKTLHDYDLAFSEKEMYSTDEQYVREIPDKLYPMEIAWKDHSKKAHWLVVGAKTSKERVIWQKSMRIAMGLGG